MVRFVLVSFDNYQQVPKTFPSGNLTKNHAHELVPASEVPYILVTITFGNNPIKNPLGQ